MDAQAMTKPLMVPLDGRGHSMNAIFKVTRYSLDHPAFKGRDMSPKYKLVEPPENPISPTKRTPEPGHGTQANKRRGNRQRRER